MPIKKYKPTTPGRRGMTSLSREEITANKPEKSLLAPLNSKGGRNNNGRITTRHQGGGHKRAYRIDVYKRQVLSWLLLHLMVLCLRLVSTSCLLVR